MTPKSRRQSPSRRFEKLSELSWELGKLLRVKRCNMRQKSGAVTEVLVNSGVSADTGGGGETESCLLLKKLQSRLELAANQTRYFS